jgi:hypothetical protein
MKLNKTLDPEKDEAIEDQSEDRDALLFYTKHKEDLDCIWKITDICSITCLIGMVVLFIALMIKIALINSFSWFFLLIPAIFTLCSYTISVNLFIRSLDLDIEGKSWVKYILINITALSTFTYLIIFCCKMEKLVLATWLVISIPLFLSLFFLSLYLMFLLPDYLISKSFFEISVISIYVFSINLFTYMIHHKLDNLNTQGEITFSQVFISLFLATGWHFVYSLFYIFYYIQEKFLKRILQLLGILLLIGSLSFTVLILDKKIKMYGYVPVLLIMFSYIFFSLFYMFKFITASENIAETTSEAVVETEKPKLIE